MNGEEGGLPPMEEEITATRRFFLPNRCQYF